MLRQPSRPRHTAGVTNLDAEEIRHLLLDLGEAVRNAVVAAATDDGRAIADIVEHGEDDTIFAIDAVAERVAVAWLETRWPAEHPVDVVMEGHRWPASPEALGTIVIDPIDGTRGLMHDKRSAWFLAGYAPKARPARLSDLTVAVMSELPVRKQRLADDWSAIVGQGPDGVLGRRSSVDGGAPTPLVAEPVAATELDHHWASVAMFLPARITELAAFSAALFEELGDPVVFHDQYLASGGQLHELLTGRDALVVDARPLFPDELSPHPYDVCVALIATEAGCIVTGLDGAPLDAPLDTSTSVGWIGIANAGLAETVQPAIQRALDRTLRA